MELYRVTIPKDDAWKVVEALGGTHSAHFIDLNKNEQPFNLPYAQRIKLCEETERKVQFLISKCKEYRIRIYKPQSAEVFAKKIKQIEDEKHKASHLLFDAIETDVADKEEFVQRMSKQITDMDVDINKMDDYIRVLNFVN
jgi:vacuolar-type H+-ATPase subunit I/STV1